MTMNPERTLEEAERRAPGLVARLHAEYGARKGPDLLPEARAVAERISADLHLAAVGPHRRAAAKTATTTAQPRSAQPTWAVTWPSLAGRGSR